MVRFRIGQEEMRFTAKASSKVVHSTWEITEDDQIASFGVEFSDNHKEIESQLTSLIGTLNEVKEDPSPLPGIKET